MVLACAGCDTGRGLLGDPLPSTSGVTADSSDSLTPSTLVGEIKINGSSTVQPISNAVREIFIQHHPEVSVTVGGDGTGNGFKDFYHQSIDIADASRPIKPGELSEVRQAEISFIELPIAYDGLTIVVNPENSWVEQLTIEQLQEIFVAGTAAKTWKDVDQRWPAQEIKIFAPGTGSGTYDYFKEVVAKDTQLRDDMTLNEDDNVLVQGVAGNKYSIGFFGVAYYAQNAKLLKAVSIVNPSTGKAALPTVDNIASNNYAPFSRPLFLYVNDASLQRAEVQTFVQFYLDNVSQLCDSGKVDYVRLPQEVFVRSLQAFDELSSGTHFIDEMGKQRSGAFAALFQASNLVKIEKIEVR